MSIYDVVAALEPGQVVRVTFEGVVDDQRIYPGHNGDHLPAVSIRADPSNDNVLSSDGMVVLRYYGDKTDPNGKVHPALVNVDIVPTINEEP